jgi:hypothetical protein
MCEKHKDTPCASHERVEAKSGAQDNEIKATPHGDSTRDGTLPKEVIIATIRAMHALRRLKFRISRSFQTAPSTLTGVQKKKL